MAWLTGRARPEDIDEERRADMAAWLTRLNLDPAGYLSYCTVTATAEPQFRLHLSEVIRDELGRVQIDHATGNVYSRPVIIAIERGSWPEWLGGLNVPPHVMGEDDPPGADDQP